MKVLQLLKDDFIEEKFESTLSSQEASSRTSLTENPSASVWWDCSCHESAHSGTHGTALIVGKILLICGQSVFSSISPLALEKLSRVNLYLLHNNFSVSPHRVVLSKLNTQLLQPFLQWPGFQIAHYSVHLGIHWAIEPDLLLLTVQFSYLRQAQLYRSEQE